MSCYVILAVAILVLVGYFIKNKSLGKLPFFIKIALPAYMMYTLFAGSIFVYVLTLNRVEQFDVVYESDILQVLVTIGVTFFKLLHWQFAAHYLESSILFKMTITVNQGRLLGWIKDKKRCIKVVEVVGYVWIVTCGVILGFLTEETYWVVYFESFFLTM